MEDPLIPAGYQLEKIKAHDGFAAKAYVDKYVNGKLEDSRYLYEDKYRGNDAEVHVGTGDALTVPIPEGAVPTGIPIEGADGTITPDGTNGGADTTGDAGTTDTADNAAAAG